MRTLAVMGVVLLGLLGAALVISQAPGLLASVRGTPALTPLEAELERPFVLYVDGPMSPEFRATLAALDARRGALAGEAVPRELLDLDIYVMVRDNWDVFRAIDGHDLGPLIRANARGRGPDAGAAWFPAQLSSPTGVQKSVLVILATQAVLASQGEFCFAVTVYDLARFSRNGALFIAATEGPGSHWKQCAAQGWRGVDDIPAEG